MLIRRFVLAFLFLLVQAGAMAHGISHLSDHHSRDQNGAGHNPVCEFCLAFSPMGAGMASTPPVWTPPDAILLFHVASPVAPPPVFQATYRNRGPPV